MTTVRPTYNEVTGEYGPNEIIHSDDGKRLTFDMADYEPQHDEAFAPREQSLHVSGKRNRCAKHTHHTGQCYLRQIISPTD